MTNEKEESAVEWYIERLLDLEYQYSKNLISGEVYKTTKTYLQEKAKEMEKNQMIEFAWECQEMFKHQIIEKFNETYGGTP